MSIINDPLRYRTKDGQEWINLYFGNGVGQGLAVNVTLRIEDARELRQLLARKVDPPFDPLGLREPAGFKEVAKGYQEELAE